LCSHASTGLRIKAQHIAKRPRDAQWHSDIFNNACGWAIAYTYTNCTSIVFEIFEGQTKLFEGRVIGACTSCTCSTIQSFRLGYSNLFISILESLSPSCARTGGAGAEIARLDNAAQYCKDGHRETCFSVRVDAHYKFMFDSGSII